MDNESGLATFSRKISLSRLREGSRLTMNTPVDSSDSELSGRDTSRVPNVSSGILIADDLEKFESEKQNVVTVAVKNEESFLLLDEGLAPDPSSGKVDPKEVPKTISTNSSESDILVNSGNFSSSQVSKMILSNIQSKYSCGDRTSGRSIKANKTV